MSHHNNQEFPSVLIDEMDRILVQIRQINDQAEALITRARDIAALAKRTVSENVKVHLESMKAEDRIRQADQVIEREVQREVERREKAIDEGKIGPGVLRPVYADFLSGTKLKEPKVEEPNARLVIGIVNNEAGAFIRDAGGNLKPMYENEQHPVSGGAYMGTGVSDLSEDLARGPVVADKIDATKIEESLPGQAEGVDTGAAEVAFPSPAEAAPVDEHAAADEPTVPAEDAHDEASAGPQVSAEMKGPAETAAEEAKVIPPEASSAADVTIPLGDRFYREKPAYPTKAAVDRAAAERAERQNANALEAIEFADKVLDLWNSTLLTEAQIAKRLATGKALIVTVLEQARTEQDPRVMGKRGAIAKLPKESMPLSAIARKIMERPAPVAATRAGVELGEFEAPQATAENLVSSGVCVVDLSRNKIFGKKGVWTTDSSRARTVTNLNNGQMYPVSVIQQRCGWRDERELRDAITPMIERLRDIGILMTSLPTGIVIRADD